VKITDEIRSKFSDKVRKGHSIKDCWLWTGKPKDGWGQIVLPINGTQTAFRAHRFSYMLHYGPIPAGKEIHQTCGNKMCVDRTTSCQHRDHLVSLTGHGAKTVQRRSCEE